MAGTVAAANKDANFGESLLALIIVLIFAIIGGFCVKMIRGIKFGKGWPFCAKKTLRGCCDKIRLCKKIVIPPLIGEIVMGAIARNFLPGSVMDKYDDSWASYIRMMCLGVILLRGGMELEFQGKGLGVILLTVIPPLFEGIIVALLAVWWLDMSMTLALCLGAVLGAVSPAVLVPCLMNLQVRGYGIVKGIPLTLLAASSFNDVFNITLFSVTSTIAFNKAGVSDKSVGQVLLIILLELIGGIAAGFVLGLLMKFFTPLNHTLKAILCLAVTVLFIVITSVFNFPEAKYVGIITFGYMCYRWWGVAGKPEHLLASIWTLFTPFLFGSIGAALKFDEIDASSILPGIGIVLVGILARSLSTIASMSIPCKYNLKEKAFMAIAWIPKATVQAAIGGVILDFAKNEKIDNYIKAGNQILTTAVISVILCAPVGAILTITFGQKWLDKREMQSKQPLKKYSKWDIVFIYVTDYYQRVEAAKKNEPGSEKNVNFFLSEQERHQRMEDKKYFLYQLKIYRDNIENVDEAVDEIEQHRKDIQAQMGSDLEFASAFSSLAGSRENSEVMTKKDKELQEKKNFIAQENKRRGSKLGAGGNTEEDTNHGENLDKNNDFEKQDNQNNNIENNKNNASYAYQDPEMKYHDDIMQNVSEFDPQERSQLAEILKHLKGLDRNNNNMKPVASEHFTVQTEATEQNNFIQKQDKAELKIAHNSNEKKKL